MITKATVTEICIVQSNVEFKSLALSNFKVGMKGFANCAQIMIWYELPKNSKIGTIFVSIEMELASFSGMLFNSWHLT